MRAFEIIITVILAFGLTNSLKSQLPISDMNEQIKQGKLEKSWRLEKIAEYEYNEQLNWFPSKLTIFYYNDENYLEGTIVYYDYSVESKKYATIIENRNSKDLDPITNIAPLKDSNLENWSNEKGSIFLTNKKENKVENYQFRFSLKSSKWLLYSLMVDTFDNNHIIQRYHYSDIDPGNFRIQESKEVYKYIDTMLVESLSISKNEKDEWNYSRKEKFEYQNNALVKKELFFYNDKEGKWELSESEEFIFDERVKTTIFFEYNRPGITKSGYKIIEKRNASNVLEQKIQFNWNDKKNIYEHYYTENITLRGNLNLEEILSYTNSSNYDKYATFNSYDSSNRLIRIEKKVKHDEDKEWSYLGGVSLIYNQEDERPSSVQLINDKGEISEENNIIFDGLKNPIKQISIWNGRKSEVEIKHDYLIESANIINLSTPKLLETYIGGKIWRHNKAPIERTYFRIDNGKKIKYKKIEYIFKEIK